MLSEKYIQKYIQQTKNCDPCDFMNHERLKYCFNILANIRSFSLEQKTMIDLFAKGLSKRVCLRKNPRNGVSKETMIEVMKNAHSWLLTNLLKTK